MRGECYRRSARARLTQQEALVRAPEKLWFEFERRFPREHRDVCETPQRFRREALGSNSNNMFPGQQARHARATSESHPTRASTSGSNSNNMFPRAEPRGESKTRLGRSETRLGQQARPARATSETRSGEYIWFEFEQHVPPRGTTRGKQDTTREKRDPARPRSESHPTRARTFGSNSNDVCRIQPVSFTRWRAAWQLGAMGGAMLDRDRPSPAHIFCCEYF